MSIILFTRFKSGIEDICLIDSGTTHTILKDKKYFSYLKMEKTNVNIISGSVKLIKNFGKISISLLRGTIIMIHKVLFFVSKF
jgi:hypothetical protein